MALAIKHLYEFGAFSLDADERELRRRGDGENVSLTPKVFSTLLLLVENRGRIVTKDEMMSALWPDAFVEESNLTFNIRKLRQALGDDAHECRYVETISRRGYRFKAEVKEVLAENYFAPPPEARLGGLPANGREIDDEKEKEADASHPFESHDQARVATNDKGAAAPTMANEATSSVVAVGAKGRKFLIVGALAIVALLLATIAAAWRHNGGEGSGGALRRDGALSAFAHGAGVMPILGFEQLTFNGSTRDAALSPDGQYIAYTREANRHQSLWLRRLATSENAQLITPADVGYGQLTFSRDGTHVFYVTTESDNLTSIYRISTFGGAPTRLIRDVKTSFALSPDERQIVFPRRNASAGVETLVVANADGTNERELIRRNRPERIDFPSWSPDGRTIVCVAGHSQTSTPSMSLIEIDVATGAERLLLRPEWFNIGPVQWLPDGASLLLRVIPRLNSAGSQLWLVPYPEGQPRQLTHDVNYYFTFSLSADASRILAIQTKRSAGIWISPNTRGSDARQIVEGDEFAWTADGRIVYTSQVGGNRDIWIVRADGSGQRQLTVNPGFDSYPAVSPDGRYIVFSSDRTGTHHLWRMNLDGSQQTQLTDGFGERSATVSPDGRWVYYNTVDRQTLWRIPIDGGAAERLTDDDAPGPSISPDGRYVAYFAFAPETNERTLAVRALDDWQTARTFRLAPGRWHSISLQWDANSEAVTYALENDGQVKLYRQTLETSPPRQISAFSAEDDFSFSWSPDGRRFAFARGNWQHDAVLIRISE